MSSWRRWTRWGTVPIVLGASWAVAVASYVAITPLVEVDGRTLTVAEAGGRPAVLVVVILPLVLAIAPLGAKPGRQRIIVTVVCATLLTLMLTLGPGMLLYVVTPAALWWAAVVMRRANTADAQ